MRIQYTYTTLTFVSFTHVPAYSKQISTLAYGFRFVCDFCMHSAILELINWMRFEKHSELTPKNVATNHSSIKCTEDYIGQWFTQAARNLTEYREFIMKLMHLCRGEKLKITSVIHFRGWKSNYAHHCSKRTLTIDHSQRLEPSLRKPLCRRC